VQKSPVCWLDCWVAIWVLTPNVYNVQHFTEHECIQHMPKQLGEDRFSTAEYYVIKSVLIITTVIVGIAFLVFAIIHVWKFLHAAMM